eukprot:4198494-Amphidinium_carterae.2
MSSLADSHWLLPVLSLHPRSTKRQHAMSHRKQLGAGILCTFQNYLHGTCAAYSMCSTEDSIATSAYGQSPRSICCTCSCKVLGPCSAA